MTNHSWQTMSLPRPQDSLELAPSDFCFFGTVKEKLGHAGVSDDDQLFDVRVAMVRSIAGEELEGFSRLGWNGFRG
jgi:hypothetical protein